MHLFNLPLLLAYLPTNAVPRSTVFGIRILYSLLLPHLLPADGGAKMALRRMVFYAYNALRRLFGAAKPLFAPAKPLFAPTKPSFAPTKRYETLNRKVQKPTNRADDLRATFRRL